MEEFEKIKWSWQTARSATESDKHYDTNLSDQRNYHVADPLRCHLLEIHPVNIDGSPDDDDGSVAPQSTATIPKDPRTGHIAPSIICDFSAYTTPNQKGLLTDVSQFTMKEQRQCADAIEKLHAVDLTDVERENIEFYHAVSELRREEKHAYLKQVQLHFDRRTSQRCTTVHPVLKDFVICKWKLSVVEAMRRFVDCGYRLQAGLPLTTTDPAAARVSAKSVHAEEEGHVLKTSKFCNNKRFLHKTANSLMSWYEAAQAARDRESIGKKCDALANEFGVNMILPLSALCQLLDHGANASANWMIDFRIDDLHDSNAFQRKSRITIGRPLPRTVMNGQDMHTVAFKYLMRSSMMPRVEEVYACNEHEVLKRPSITDNPSACDASDFQCKPFDDYLTELYDKQKHLTMPRGNTMYRIWELTKGDADDPMRILITSKQDGYQSVRDDCEYVNYSTKVEFQNEFGAEQMTKSELLREWCRCYFRPNSITHRLRIDVQSQRIVQSKQITVADIERDLQRLHQIDGRMLLDHLWNMLRTLQKFPQGDYLFRHEPKHNNQVMVYAKTDDKNALHLPDIYATIDFHKSWSETSQWVPIDDSELTITHRMGQVMPCAFPHYRDAHAQSKKKRGKKNAQHSINPRDDRNQIVERIQFEQQSAEDRIKARMNIKKNAKKRRRMDERKKERQKKTAMDKEYIGETLDPYLIFDPSGNVSIAGLVKATGSLFKVPVDASKGGDESADTSADAKATDPEPPADARDIICDTVTIDEASKEDSVRPSASSEITSQARPIIDQMDRDIFTENTQSSPDTEVEYSGASPSGCRNNRKTTPKRGTSTPLSPVQTVTRSGRLVKPKLK